MRRSWKHRLFAKDYKFLLIGTRFWKIFIQKEKRKIESRFDSFQIPETHVQLIKRFLICQPSCFINERTRRIVQLPVNANDSISGIVGFSLMDNMISELERSLIKWGRTKGRDLISVALKRSSKDGIRPFHSVEWIIKRNGYILQCMYDAKKYSIHSS